MRERDRETIKLIAGICGNIAVVAVGVALFDGNLAAIYVAVSFGILAIVTIRGLP